MVGTHEYPLHNQSVTGIRKILNTPIIELPAVIFLVVLGLFEPEVVRQMHPSLHRLFKLCQLFCYVVSVASMVEWRRFPKTCLFILLLSASAIISKYLSPFETVSSYASILKTYFLLVVRVGLVAYWAIKVPHRFCGITAGVISVFGVLNLMAEVTRPMGLYQTAWTHVPCFVFGHKNSVFPSMLPGLICVALFERQKTEGIGKLTWAYLLLLGFNVLFSKSSTAVVAFAVVLLLVTVTRKKSFRAVGPFQVFFGEVIGMMLLVVIKIQTHFAALVQLLFNKTVGFSSRDLIWSNWFELFRFSPLTGVGEINQEVLRRLTGGVNSHEFLLGVLGTGGLVRFFVYFVGALALGSMAKPHMGDIGVKVISVSLAGLAVVGLMEMIDLDFNLLFIVAIFESYLFTLRSGQTNVA